MSLPPSGFVPPSEADIVAIAGSYPTIPTSTSEDGYSVWLSGSSYRTFETEMSRGLVPPRPPVGPIKLGLRYPLSGVLREVGSPIVYQWYDETEGADSVTWTISVYRSARAPADPHWFHVSQTPVREFSGTTDGATTLFSIPPEEVSEAVRIGTHVAWATLLVSVTVEDAEGEVIGTAEVVTVFEVEYAVSYAALVPSPAAAVCMQSALSVSATPAVQMSPAAEVEALSGKDSTPVVLVDPLGRS